MITITATQLASAVLDPQWRRQWLAGENPSTWLFPPTGAPVVHGGEFHEIVAGFTRWLVAPDHASQTTLLTKGVALFDACYDRFAAERLREILTKRPDQGESVLKLKDALQHFCVNLANLRKALPFCNKWSDLYLSVEATAQPGIFTFGSATIQVNGRWDAVRRHPSLSHEVVDYKLSRGNNLQHDMVQLAIYAQLLQKIQPEAHFGGTIEYYLPHLQKQSVSREELSALFAEMVLPVLAELACGQNQPDDPPRDPRTTMESVTVKDPMAERIVEVFANFKLKVAVIGRVEAPQLVRYQLLPDGGVKTVSLASRAKDIMVHLNLESVPVISAAPGMVTLDISKATPDLVAWSQWMADPVWSGAGPLAFPVGVSVENQLLIGDLSEPTQCHLLVAGTTGSGKSVFLQALVATLMRRNTPKNLCFIVVDPKLVTFTALEGSPFLERPMVTNMDEAMECLHTAVEEMERRTRLLKQAKLPNLQQWHARGDCPHPYWVLVFDEFADLILAGGPAKKEFEKQVSRLAGKARATGIHLVLATQRPDREVVSGLIKANLQLKICLRVTNSINSQMVLGETGAENLLGKGDLLVNLGPNLQRGQALFVTDQMLADAASSRAKR